MHFLLLILSCSVLLNSCYTFLFGQLSPVPFCVPSKYTFIKLYGLSLFECARQCRRSRRCRSINYIRSQLFCGLNEKELTSVFPFMRGCQGFNVPNNKDFFDDCKSTDSDHCQLHEQCTIDNNDDTIQCDASDCGTAPEIPNSTIEKFYDRSVGSTIRYICNDGFKPIGKREATCTSDGKWTTSLDCKALPPEKYICIETYCFKPSTNKLSYKKSKEECANNGSRLVSNLDERKNKIIKDYLQKTQPNSKECYMIDLIRLHNGDWVWGSTNSIPDYEDWAPNEPSNREMNVSCMYGDENEYKWHDAALSWTSLRFICEYL